jgi:GNAT superfamily N-acetyltransferase
MRADDAEEVAHLAGQLGYPSTAHEIATRFRSLRLGEEGAAYVAQARNAGLLGWIHVEERQLIESDPFAEITGLVVDSEARRTGIGRALVEEAERWAAGRGLPQVRVRSNTARDLARPFYERMGYTVSKTQYVLRKSVG